MGKVFCFDEFELDAERSELRRGGVPIKVETLVLRLLEVFVQNARRVIVKEEFATLVWDGRAITDNALTVAIARLRKVLTETAGKRDYVLTVHGRGYRFLPFVSERDGSPVPHQVSVRSTPFVGRERVMTHLRSAMRDASSGAGSLIALSGTSGIGKTRIAEEAARDAANADLAIAWGYGRELGNTPPLWPFVGLLREVSERLGPALAADPGFQRLLSELVMLLPEFAVQAAAIQQVPTVPHTLEPGSRYRLFESVVRAFALAASHKPLLLIIDDLHRADEVSLELLEYLLPSISRMRILLLGTVHNLSDGGSGDALSRVLAHRNSTRVSVGPLDRDQVSSYLGAVFGSVGESLLQHVFRISEGNPFYVTELVRQLRHNTQCDPASLMVPTVALELVRQRLARLDAETHHVLTCAAVIGRSFSLPILQAVLKTDAHDVMRRIDEALAQEVLVRDAKSATDYAFGHELLRTAIYDALAPMDRRSWHLRVSEVLDERRALAEVPIADLAHHAWSALPHGDLRKAVASCSEAAHIALRGYAFHDATRYLQHACNALDLMDNPSANLRFGLLIRQAIIARGRSTREFLPLADQLMRIARQQGKGELLAIAALLLDPFPGFPRFPRSQNALSDALAALPAEAKTKRPALMARLATSAPLAYDAEAGSALLEEALALARGSSDLGDQFTAHFGALYRYGGPAHVARAAEALSALQDLCSRAAAGPLPVVLLDLHRTLAALQAGEVATATRALARCRSACRELEAELSWYVERLHVMLRINQGGDEDARVALEALHDHAQGPDPILGSELFCAYDQSLGLAADDPRIDWQRALAPRADDPPSIWALKLRALVARNALDEARRGLCRVPAAQLARLPCDREYLGTLAALSHVAIALDAGDYTGALYALLQPFEACFAINLSGYCEGSVAQLLGRLARSHGSVPQRAHTSP